MRVAENNRSQTFTNTAIAVFVVALFLLGWKMAAGLFAIDGKSIGLVDTGMPSNISLSVSATTFAVIYYIGFLGFFLVFSIIYSSFFIKNFFGRSLNGYTHRSILFYTAAAFIMAFCSGLFLGILRASSLEHETGYGALYVTLSFVTVIIISTLSLRIMRPNTVLNLLPISVFLAGMFVSKVQFIGLHSSKYQMIQLRNIIDGFDILVKLIGPIGTVAGSICILMAAIYFFARPSSVLFHWNGYPLGNSLNTLIAIFLVVAPYVTAGSKELLGTQPVYSIADCIFNLRGGKLVWLAWSWLIGNGISLIPLFTRKVH